MADYKPIYTLLPPQTAYAEDMPWSKTILTVHVAHRGLQAGALFSIPIASAYHRFQLSRHRQAARQLEGSSAQVVPQLRQSILRGAGRGAAISAVASVAFTFNKLAGAEAIEWQDRAWRLRGSFSQREVDAWTFPAMGMAALGVAARRPPGGAVGALGAIALGNLAGLGAMMGWRGLRMVLGSKTPEQIK